MRLYLYIVLLSAFFASLLACSKRNFLDAKPSSNFVVPATISNFQSLLDNTSVIETPALGETSSDNYYISDYSIFQTLQTKDQNTYLWAMDIFSGQGNDADWNEQYQNILIDNVILEGLANIDRTSTNSQDYDNVRGQAFFNRGFELFNVAQSFSPAYDSATENSDLGIPLKLTSDIQSHITRSTLGQTYKQIISDLLASKELLPTTIPSINRNRPSKPAAFGMLARIYLSMRSYTKALLYSDSCLRLYDSLMNFNDNKNTTTTPFTNSNPEVIYQSNIYSSEQVLWNLRFQNPGFSVDTLLYRSYDLNDLRAFFYFVPKTPTSIYTKSGYTGSTTFFSGIATDEIFLIRSECNARIGNTSGAMSDLNKLLIKRWKSGSFSPLSAISSLEALTYVLNERRKELPFRGLRWNDLKRLNREGANITLRRSLNGLLYTLAPNSPFYIFPIPPDVIAAGNYIQNDR